MPTTCLHLEVLWVSLAAMLGVAMPGVSARAHSDRNPCERIADKEQRRACEHRYHAFHECRKHYRDCGFAAIGDSQADEYLGFSNKAGYNWLEQLARVRGLDFGAYEADPAVRGEPRNDGYENNWARSAASVTSPTYAEVLPWAELCLGWEGGPCTGEAHRLETITHFSTQVEGLAAQVSAGKVQVIVLMMGHNDFLIYRDFLGGTFDDPLFDRVSADVISGLASAVDTLQAAGPVMIVAARIPGDFGPVGNEAMARTNAQLADEMASRGVPMFDEYTFFGDPGLTRVTPLPDGTTQVDLMVGSYAVPLAPILWVPSVADLVAPDDPRAIGPCRIVGIEWWDPVDFFNTTLCATLEYQLSAYMDDHTHISTLASGLAANVVVTALHTAYGLKIPPLRASEILSSAGIIVPGEEHRHDGDGCDHDRR